MRIALRFRWWSIEGLRLRTDLLKKPQALIGTVDSVANVMEKHIIKEISV